MTPLLVPDAFTAHWLRGLMEEGFEILPLPMRAYADGETQRWAPRVLEEEAWVAVADLPCQLWEVVQLVAAARAAGARRVTLLAPSLGYLRQDKPEAKPEAAPAPALAACWGALLAGAGCDALVTFSPHNPALVPGWRQHLGVTVRDGLAQVVVAALQTLPPETVLVALDQGRRAEVQTLAGAHGRPWAALQKVRAEANQIASLTWAEDVAGVVPGRPVLLVDDLLDTGGTLVKAAEACRAAGAQAVHVAVAHGLGSPEVPARLQAAGVARVFVLATRPELAQRWPQAEVVPLRLR